MVSYKAKRTLQMWLNLGYSYGKVVQDIQVSPKSSYKCFYKRDAKGDLAIEMTKCQCEDFWQCDG